MATSTVENYLKQLYLEQHNAAGEMVAVGKLATAMGVVPGTATSMVKALSDSGLVEYEPRGGVRLTHSGQQLADADGSSSGAPHRASKDRARSHAGAGHALESEFA